MFEESYASGIQEVRLGRLSPEDRQEVEALTQELQTADEEAEKAFARLATLLTKADAYDPLTLDTEFIECQYRIYQSVWKEAEELRSRGKFLEAARKVCCPVVAIHGDHDPHPPEGVQIPLSGCLTDFRFIVLKNCGHLPWIERQARDTFYGLLRQECRA